MTFLYSNNTQNEIQHAMHRDIFNAIIIIKIIVFLHVSFLIWRV